MGGHWATILRGGRVTGDVDPRDHDSHDLARMMIGRDMPAPLHLARRRELVDDHRDVAAEHLGELVAAGLPAHAAHGLFAQAGVRERLAEARARELQFALERSRLEKRALDARLALLHAQIRRELPAVDRVACALYEPETDMLRTFVHSTDQATPLRGYHLRLADSPSLAALVAGRGERVIDDIATGLHDHGSAHTQWLLTQGYRSSYTLPLFEQVLARFLANPADKGNLP